jgi:hypothetical protein
MLSYLMLRHVMWCYVVYYVVVFVRACVRVCVCLFYVRRFCHGSILCWDTFLLLPVPPQL